MNVADALEAAADLLFVNGRCKGYARNQKGEYCVRGAIAAAYGEEVEAFSHGEWREADKALGRYLAAHPELIRHDTRETHAEYVERGAFPTWIWNDTTYRDDELVIDTLRKCAKELREDEG